MILGCLGDGSWAWGGLVFKSQNQRGRSPLPLSPRGGVEQPDDPRPPPREFARLPRDDRHALDVDRAAGARLTALLPQHYLPVPPSAGADLVRRVPGQVRLEPEEATGVVHVGLGVLGHGEPGREDGPDGVGEVPFERPHLGFGVPQAVLVGDRQVLGESGLDAGRERHPGAGRAGVAGKVDDEVHGGGLRVSGAGGVAAAAARSCCETKKKLQGRLLCEY